MTYFFAFIFGSIWGCFYNVLIQRLPRDETFILSRSRCPACKHSLYPKELVPIFSYLYLKGKCNYCQVSIPIRYLITEITAAIIATLLWHQFGWSLTLLKYTVFFSAVLISFFTDLETYIIPTQVTYPLILFGFGFALYEHTLLNSIYGFLIGGLTYLIIGWIGSLFYKKTVMGGGDVLLGAAIGACWGWKTATITCYLSFISGGVISGALLATKVKTLKDNIPFGPAIIIGSVIAILWGDYLWALFII